ncbi:hypothetical protein Tco_0233479 [Tanacetum coccineum]
MAYTLNSLRSDTEANLEIVAYQLGLESVEAQLVVHQKNEVVYEEKIKVLEFEVKDKSNDITRLKKQLDETLREKYDLKAKLEKFETSSKNLNKLINSQLSAKDKTGLGYGDRLNENDSSGSELFNSVFDSRSNDGDDNQTNDRFKKDNGYHVVPTPLTRNYMPPLANLSFAGLDDYVYRPTANKTSASVSQVETSTSQTSNTSVEMPRVEYVRPSGVIIEDWVSDDEDIFQSNDLQATNKPSFKRVEFSNAKNESIKPKQAKKPRMITQNPKERITVKGKIDQFRQCLEIKSANKICSSAVLTRFGRVPVSAAKQSSLRATTSTSTFRPVNTATHTNRLADVKGNGYTVLRPIAALEIHNKLGRTKEYLTVDVPGNGQEQRLAFLTIMTLWRSTELMVISYKSSDETYKNDTADDVAGETPVQFSKGSLLEKAALTVLILNHTARSAFDDGKMVEAMQKSAFVQDSENDVKIAFRLVLLKRRLSLVCESPLPILWIIDYKGQIGARTLFIKRVKDDILLYYETVNLEQEVACLMLSSMSPDLQMTLEKYNAYDMLKELKTMFEEQAKQELFETVKAFHACKQEEGQSVSSYLLKMKSYLDTLERLGYVMPNELGMSLILNSFNKDYDQFTQNYNMNSMGKMIAELHAMLKLYEKGIPKKAKTLVVLAIREGKIQKDKKKLRAAKSKDKGKNKLAYAPKPKIPPPPKRDNPTKDSICHH